MKKILVFLMSFVLIFSSVDVHIVAKANTSTSVAKVSNTSYSLLKGRLFVSMPKGCSVKNLSDGNSLASQLSNERETSITYKKGSEEIVLYAKELFCYSRNNLLKDVNTLLDNDSSDPLFTLTSARTLDGLAMVLIKPTKIFSTEDGTFVSGAIVRHQNGNLISIYIYANEAAYEGELGCTTSSDQILKSIKKGTKALSVSKRNVIIDKNLQVPVQKGYAAFVEVGNNFNVYNFVKVIPVGGYWSNMGIYSGAGIESSELLSDSITEDGKILGQDVKWIYNYFDASNSKAQIFVDAYFSLQAKDLKTGKTKNNNYHIFLDSNSKADIGIMKNMASAMKIVSNTK